MIDIIKNYIKNNEIIRNRIKGMDRVAIEVLRTMRQPLPSNLMDEFVQLMFEDQRFPCFREWDEYLNRKFGEYMKYPPIEEQTWQHHPIILDFTRNIEEIETY